MLTSIVLIFTLVPSILVLSLSKNYITNFAARRYISDYVSTIEEEFGENISSFIYRISMQSLYFTTQNALYVTLFDENLSYDEKQSNISNQISDYIENSFISGISIITNNDEIYHFCDIPRQIFMLDKQEIEKSISPSNMFLSKSHYYNGKYYFSVGTKLRNYYTGYDMGYLIMHIPESALEEMYQNYAVDSGYVFITHNNTILSHHNKSLIGSKLFLESEIKNNGLDNIDFGNHYIISKRKISANGIINNLEIVSVTPKTVFDKMLATLNKFFIILLFAAVTLSILFSVFISKKLLSEIEILMQNIYSFGKSPTDYRPTFKLYEIRELESVFKNMTLQLNSLIENIKDEKEKQRIAELSALQAQINPHFIYNTLDTISWMLLMKDDKETYEIIYALANFFRIALHGGMKVITIDKELSHLKNYLVIQKLRFPDKFEITYDIDDKILNLKMIKIILQPIVENAIKHGFDKMEKGGKINVKGFLTDEGDIKFIVTDNGCGMDFDPINSPKKTKDADSGYGISNINERLKLACGEKYGLKFISSPGKGTTVEILVKPHKE